MIVLRCVDEIWVYERTCLSTERCDAASGCRSLDPLCVELATESAVCVGDEVLDCRPHLPNAVHLHCPFGCRDGACLPASGDELVVHADFGEDFETAWPEIRPSAEVDIPVCFLNSPSLEIEQWMRSEVETTWGRSFHVNFTGWTACETEATGVLVAFEDKCDGRLANAVSLGYPGAEASVLVEVCERYANASGVWTPADESLIRFLARHQFGHVLGLPDGDSETATMMVRGVRSSRVDDLRPTFEDVSFLDSRYARKPTGAVVTPSGRCLTLWGTSVEARACTSSAAAEQDWELANQDLRHTKSGPHRCIGVSNDGGLEAGACSPRPSWALSRAQLTNAGFCLTAGAMPPTPGTPLLMQPCGATGDASQSWNLQILDVLTGVAKYRTRIQLSDSDYCVRAARSPARHEDPLHLQVCVKPEGGAADLLTLQDSFFLSRDGMIYSGTSCLRWLNPGSAVFLEISLCFPTAERRWVLRGAFEGVGAHLGKVLSLDSEGRLQRADLQRPPRPEEIFDVYF